LTSNAELHARRERAVPRGVANSLAVYAERATNAELWDVEGRRYVDFASGISVLNTGHVHPKVAEAIARQLEKLTHTCFQVTPYESYIALAEGLNALAPGAGPKKTIFLTTGAEAVENARPEVLQALDEFRSFAGDHEDFIAYNRAFHSALAYASGNRRMAAALCDLIGQADRLVRVSVANVKGHNPAQLVAEHVALIEAMQRRGVHVTVISTIASQPPMVADELRRQADVFVDLAELKSKLARDPSERPGPREMRQQSPQFASRGTLNGSNLTE